METTVEIEKSNAEELFERVDSVARIAVYDDLMSSPRIIEIQPNTTREYINDIAATVHAAAKAAGGAIPYSIILQVAENFIHSYFSEVVVTVLDDGNTIRFSDQGPGIVDKQKAKTPGFSSATAPMKKVIHGVGSGLPIVSEYMETMHGRIDIEDNMVTGAVVTISLKQDESNAEAGSATVGAAVNQSVGNVAGGASNGVTDGGLPVGAVERDAVIGAKAGGAAGNGIANTGFTPAGMDSSTTPGFSQNSNAPASRERLVRAMLSERGMDILKLFQYEDVWGVTDIATQLNLAPSTVHNELKKLEEAGMITKLGKKRVATEMGTRFLNGEL